MKISKIKVVCVVVPNISSEIDNRSEAQAKIKNPFKSKVNVVDL